VVILTVYRRENAPVFANAVAPAIAAGWDVRAWGLDGVEPGLAGITCGSGPAGRFDLMNRLLAASPADPTSWTVVLDDDVRFVHGDVPRFVGFAIRAGLDLAQPAHVQGSAASHQFTLARRSALARTTTFVEIGPVFALSPGGRDRIFPLQTSSAMGWGADVAWSALTAEGFRLGIVDAITMEHLAAVGLNYPTGDERQALLRAVRDAGATSLEDLQRTTEVWRPWQLRAPWLRSPSIIDPRGTDSRP
jgi:hypothetical protein